RKLGSEMSRPSSLLEDTTHRIRRHRSSLSLQSSGDRLEYCLVRRSRAATRPSLDEDPLSFDITGKVSNDTPRPERGPDAPRQRGQHSKVCGRRGKAFRIGNHVQVVKPPSKWPAVHNPDTDLLGHWPVSSLAGNSELVPLSSQDEGVPAKYPPQ